LHNNTSAGQLRTWKEKYFKLTPPGEGFEMMLLISESRGTWTVMFNGGHTSEMTEESIRSLTRLISDA